MKLDYLYRGLPGHPLHPPLTDATIGTYTFATICAFLDVLGISEDAAATGFALGLVVGLVLTVPTALTGFADWLQLERGTPLFRTATAHLFAMVSATVLFLLAAAIGYSDAMDGVIEAAPFVLALAGFLVLSTGGWLGGSIVYVHGMRVLNLVDEPARLAAAPVPTPEKEEAAKS
ncbi:MAG: DUF2231 domain-containing protein [Gaiellaceae bacterium]